MPVHQTVEDGADANNAKQRGLREGNVEATGGQGNEYCHDRKHDPATVDQSAEVGKMIGVFAAAGNKWHGANYA